MKKVIIIGGGFAGLTAASRLVQFRPRLEISLIDKKESADFLPVLPDCLGRGIEPGYLIYNVPDAAQRRCFKFINGEVSAIDLEKREVLVNSAVLAYDYLLISSGSETNFYGNENIRQNSLKLDDAGDIKTMLRVLGERAFDNYIIVGGGYTGIEVATNLRVFLDKTSKSARIVVIERAPSILGPLPQWMKDYAGRNLKKMRVDCLVNSSIERIEADRVFVSGGKFFENALVIWAAGVKTAQFIQDLRIDKNPQGRVKVDKYLRLNETCFVAGDAANFSSKGSFLRMAVQFSLAQGNAAAENIIRSIRNIKLKAYAPRDLGYIIPMANNRSCGVVLGINLKGFIPTVLHFMMCIYRSYGIRNKIGIMKGLFK